MSASPSSMADVSRGGCALNDQHSAENQTLSVAEYIRRTFVPISHLSHDWEMHSAAPLTPAEERTMVRSSADRKSTRLNSSHTVLSRMPSSA